MLLCLYIYIYIYKLELPFFFFGFLFLVSMTNGFDWSMVIGVWVRIFELSHRKSFFYNIKVD